MDFKDPLPADDTSLFAYYYSKALTHYLNAEYFSAIHAFKRSLAYDPTHFESYINLGVSYYNLQLLDEALAIFNKCLKLQPKSPVPYVNKALTQLQMQNHSQVIITIDNALGILRDPPEELYKLRTFVLCQSGKVTNVLDDIKKNNGFEPRKQFRQRKIAKVNVESNLTVYRPQTGKKSSKLVGLYPDVSKTFFEVNEISFRSTHRNMSQPLKRPLSSANSKNSDKGRNRAQSRTKQKPGLGNLDNHIQEKVRVYTIEPKPNFKPGVIQINALDKNEEFLETDEAALKFNNKLKALKNYVAQDLLKTEELKASSKDSEFDFITENQIKTLISEFNNKIKNLEKIDKIAVKLEFLGKFPLAMRESIYLCARIACFYPGEIVFREGDPGEDMFVIIKGSVIINKRISEVRNHPLIIASLYDGRQFGDVSVLSSVNEKEPRKGTCIVTELSTMFIIPKNEYKRLLFKYLKPELEARVNFLLTVRLFKKINSSALFSLASNIITKKFSLGDIILAKGDMPKGLYIVTQGHIEVVTEGFVSKRDKPKVYGNAKIREKSPRPFYTGNLSPSASPKQQSFDNSMKTTNPTNKKPSSPQSPKRNSGKSFDILDKVKDSILNFVLYPTEFFGGKIMLDNEMFLGTFNKASPSKFSFIAQSSEVKVMLILKEHLQFLDAQTEFYLKNMLSKSFHIDSPEDIDAEEMDDLFNKWQDYKKQIVEDIHKMKFLERNRQDFPFIR